MGVRKNILSTILLAGLSLGTPSKSFSPSSPQIKKRIKKEKLELKSPVNIGQISSLYGKRGRKFHYGLDIAIPFNDIKKYGRPDILSADEGIINSIGTKGGYGNFISIKHNDSLNTFYAHLKNIFVKKGDTVYSQQQIGKMGNTGRSRGTHLHFEVKINGKQKNPSNYLKQPTKIDDIIGTKMNHLPEIKIYPKEEKFYSLQIAASTTPLSEKEIQLLEKKYQNKTQESIMQVNGKKYFKYSIKRTKNQEEIKSLEKILEKKYKQNFAVLTHEKNKITGANWN
jgi:DNA-binding CsgD family transcriptional regulator